MPTDELTEHMTRRYNKRRDAKDARQPIPIRMSDDEPVGLIFFGDPHLDSPAVRLAGIKALCGRL